ncbi:MAG TPA: hypothetical protein VH436_09340 [Vicinamibacterales bacterium]
MVKTTHDADAPIAPARKVLALFRRVDVLAGIVFIVVFLYRFNGLGGALGGFDGDHFIFYLRTVAVAHGERPLRDFADALQGAWPALTYELPALAQKIGGETLLSEAVFVVGAIATALTVQFVTAARLAGPVSAFVVTMLTMFTATKSYGYTKLVVFGVAAALFLQYVRRPTRSSLVLLAVWSAATFLFRHDYLVYLAPPTAVLIMLGSSGWRAGIIRLCAYGAIVTVLLAGPLYSIQHYVGMRPFVETNLAIVASESTRTNLGWPQLTPEPTVGEFISNEKNAAAWMYYIALSIPPLAVAALFWSAGPRDLDARQRRAIVVSLAVLAFVLNRYLLRGNLGARIGDLGAPVAILAAWLATSFRDMPIPMKVVGRTVTALVLVSAALAISTIGSVWHELDTTGFRDSIEKTVRRVSAVSDQLRALPPPAGTISPGGPTVSDYIHACTTSSQRVLLVADSPEILAMAARSFAAGHPTFKPGFFTLEHDQRLMLERLHAQDVPVVVTDLEQKYLQNFASQFTLIHEFITKHYELAGQLPAPAGDPVRVFVRRGREFTSHYGSTTLPCSL